MDNQMRKIVDRLQDWVLQQGIQNETKQAGLVEKAIHLSFGEISYLQSVKHGATGNELVLMLHGAAADKTTWVRFCKHLTIDLPLVIPDLPGHGRSTSDLTLSYSIGAQTLRIEELLSALGIKRVHVIANSMGGAIALRLAASHPEIVASLVLIDTVGVQGQESWLQEHMRKTGNNPMIAVRNKQDYLTMMGIGMQKPPYIPGFILSSLSRAYISRLPINEKISKDIELDLSKDQSLSAISCRTLVIWGSEDKVSHVSNGEQIHRKLASCQIEIMQGIGHVPMVEAPKQAADICNSFFSAKNISMVH